MPEQDGAHNDINALVALGIMPTACLYTSLPERLGGAPHGSQGLNFATFATQNYLFVRALD